MTTRFSDAPQINIETLAQISGIIWTLVKFVFESLSSTRALRMITDERPVEYRAVTLILALINLENRDQVYSIEAQPEIFLELQEFLRSDSGHGIPDIIVHHTSGNQSFIAAVIEVKWRTGVSFPVLEFPQRRNYIPMATCATLPTCLN